MNKNNVSSKTKKNKNLKAYFIEHKKELIIGLVVLVAVTVCIVFLIANSKDDKVNNETNNNVSENNNENLGDEEEYEKVTEDLIIQVYGVSKEEAINIVKPFFNSDNFEFSVDISSEAKYIVTAKNVITNNEYKFEVDPATKQYYEI